MDQSRIRGACVRLPVADPLNPESVKDDESRRRRRTWRDVCERERGRYSNMEREEEMEVRSNEREKDDLSRS